MNESFFGKRFQHLQYLREARHELHLDKLDIELLRAQAGSEDQSVAQKAQRLLRVHWDLEPEKSANNATTVDIMEQLEGYTQEEIQSLLSEIVSIQLTSGCNGDCTFCLFGRKKGVSAKYSFKSIVEFFSLYKNQLDKYISFYWDSDPFDYEDGESRILDVYRAWRDIRPNQYLYLSTAIPKGCQESFITYATYLAREQLEKIQTGSNITARIRISVSKHNIQRVEMVIIQLTNQLQSTGYSKKEIELIFKEIIIATDVFTDLDKLGDRIGKHDDFVEVHTPACRDGVVITPQAIQAIFTTAPTMYRSSGQETIAITPSSLRDGSVQIPKTIHKVDYIGLATQTDMSDRVTNSKLMLPIARTASGSAYELTNQIDNAIFKLGREIASIGGVISDIASIHWTTERFRLTNGEPQFFLHTLLEKYDERSQLTLQLLAESKLLLEDTHNSPDEVKKIEYYIILLELYLAKMDFIADQIRLGRSIELVETMALVFRFVGRDQVNLLPAIMDKLKTTTHPAILYRISKLQGKYIDNLVNRNFEDILTISDRLKMRVSSMRTKIRQLMMGDRKIVE